MRLMCARIRRTFRTRHIFALFQRLIRSITCSSVERLEQRWRGACAKLPYVANCAAMCRRLNPISNKLRAINWSEWVFRSGVRGGLGNSVPGWWTPGTDRQGAAGDSDRLQRLATGAGSSGSDPAPLQQNQGFGAIRFGIVAPGSSQRIAGSAEISRFAVPCRLIACLPTICSAIAMAASGAPRLGQRPRGVVPPFGPRLAPYAGSAHRAGNLENRPAAFALRLGRRGAACRQGPNVRRCPMGLGVRTAPRRERSAARKNLRGSNRVGVKVVHAGTWPLGDSALTVGGARG